MKKRSNLLKKKCKNYEKITINGYIEKGFQRIPITYYDYKDVSWGCQVGESTRVKISCGFQVFKFLPT